MPGAAHVPKVQLGVFQPAALAAAYGVSVSEEATGRGLGSGHSEA
jgi:hypothetical protein